MKQIWAIVLGSVLMICAVVASGIVWRTEKPAADPPESVVVQRAAIAASDPAPIVPERAVLPADESPSSAPQNQGSKNANSTAVAAGNDTSVVIENVKSKDHLLAALEKVTNFGQGEAGVSLKTAIAVSALLDWAQQNASKSDVQGMAQAIGDWVATLPPEKTVLFYENWPNVYELGLIVCRDTGSYKSLFDEAGAPLTLDRYDPTTFQRLGSAMDWLMDK